MVGTRPAIELLMSHVERFNHGVRTGDFGRMVAAFVDSGVMSFQGAPLGPYEGRAAIAAAYRDSPPGDEIELLETVERADGTVAASYAWKSEPNSVAGEIRLTPAGNRIARLEVMLGTHLPDVTPS